MSAIPQAPFSWQAGFLAVVPAIETHAKIHFNHLRREQREDAIQEAIASACVSYQVLAAKGKPDVAHPGTLATYAVKQVRSGRHVGGRQNSARDVMSPVAQARHRFKTGSYDVFSEEVGDWREVAVEGRKTSIPDLAAFRIDYARWLRTLTCRDRRIIRSLTRGDGAATVADRFGVSRGRVSQLRRKYERAWQVFQGVNAQLSSLEE